MILDVLLILATGLAFASCMAPEVESDFGAGMRFGVFVCAVTLAAIWLASLVLFR